MSIFLKKIIVFLSLVLLFNTGVFLFALNEYYQPYYEQPPKNCSTFIFADSHGEPLGNPHVKKGIYNFSYPGDNYKDMKNKIQFLIDHDYPVATIILSLDDHLFSTYRENLNNNQRSILYSTYSGAQGEPQFLRKKYLEYYLPLLSGKVRGLFRLFIFSKIKKIAQPSKTTVRKKALVEISDVKSQDKSEQRINTIYNGQSYSKSSEKELYNLLKLCQSNNITIFGLKFPVSSSYAHAAAPYKNNFAVDKNKLDVKMLDYERLFFEHPEYFADQDHLSELGGRILFNTLVSDIDDTK
jgi:hypothetical protein